MNTYGLIIPLISIMPMMLPTTKLSTSSVTYNLLLYVVVRVAVFNGFREIWCSEFIFIGSTVAICFFLYARIKSFAYDLQFHVLLHMWNNSDPHDIVPTPSDIIRWPLASEYRSESSVSTFGRSVHIKLNQFALYIYSIVVYSSPLHIQYIYVALTPSNPRPLWRQYNGTLPY